MFKSSATAAIRPDSHLRGPRRGPLFLLALPVFALVIVAFSGPASAAAQQPNPDAAAWISGLQAAPVTPAEAPIEDFANAILVPPPFPNQFSAAAIDSAGSTNNGMSYDIILILPNGRAELRGTVGRGDYDQAVASAPPGCRTATGRSRGYCFFDVPHYEYFPGLSVAGSPAIAVYGGFETNYSAIVGLSWYDADRDVSYSLTIFGSDAVAQAGFSGRTPTEHLRPAKDLAALASRFIGI